MKLHSDLEKPRAGAAVGEWRWLWMNDYIHTH